MHPCFRLEREAGPPVVAVALHAGHDLREEVSTALAVEAMDRLREEDPYTDAWTVVAPVRVMALLSRFEVDLNRPREGAVYRTAQEAWGMKVWSNDVPEAVVERSLEEWDAFYHTMEDLLEGLARRHGRFVVLDLHSYNHRRAGPEGPPEPPAANPEVNVGTRSLDRARWGALVDRFVRDLADVPVLGHRLDVRENVRFGGGHFAQWVHERFPAQGCALAVEFKKTYMDEWTGRPDPQHVAEVARALRSTLPGLVRALGD